MGNIYKSFLTKERKTQNTNIKNLISCLKQSNLNQKDLDKYTEIVFLFSLSFNEVSLF